MRDFLCGSVLLLCGLGTLGAAAWQYFAPEEGPGLIADDPEREISGCSPGQTTALTFAFHNRSSRAVQIVGLAPC